MREFRLILKAIENFELNLKGYCVITEAANGNYLWTPIIAAKAGAYVYAYSNDSPYGSFKEIKGLTNKIAKEFRVYNNIEIINELKPEIIYSADIITNLGFLRPLNEAKLKYCGPFVSIPLMWETWEYREKDLDLSYCFKNGIPVLGTNESDKYLNTFKYLGMIIKKVLLNSNIEIYKSNIIILGNDIFAGVIEKSLNRDGAVCYKFSSTNSKTILNLIKNSDAIIISDHTSENTYFKKTDKANPETVSKINPEIPIIHLTGGIDKQEIKKFGLNILPKKQANIHNMSFTTGYIGPKPIIDLHTAGLKIGKLMTNERRKNVIGENVIKNVLRKSNLAMDFSLKQKNKYYK